MITLTTPAIVNSVLGGSVPVNYDKFALTSLTHDPVNMRISCFIAMTSTASPDMQAITGSMTVSATGSQGVLEFEVRQLDFYRRVRLTAEQAPAVLTMILNAQTAVETGLIGLGIVVGTQTEGV